MAYSRYSRDSHWFIFWVAPLTLRRSGGLTAGPREAQLLAMWHVDHQDESPTLTYAEAAALLQTRDFSQIPGFTDADRSFIAECLGEFVADVDEAYQNASTPSSEA